jgi:hypothetical protein
MGWGYQTTATVNGFDEYRAGYDGIEWDVPDDTPCIMDAIEDCVTEILHLQSCSCCGNTPGIASSDENCR